MDFDQTCTAMLLRQGQELIRFGDLDPFTRSHGGSDCWKMACLQNQWVDLTKLVHLYCCDMEKN